MQTAYKILMIGPQGSGKGTQADILAKHLGIPTFAMGQLIRDEIVTGSDFGKKINEIFLRGDLISDEDAAYLLRLRLAKSDTAHGYILDGYPRNLAQKGEFTFDTPTHVVVIDLLREESLKRLSGRLTCRACTRVFAMRDGHQAGGTCPVCGGELFQRADDTPEAIARRLEIYEGDTQPVIAGYEEQGLVRHVDGMGSVQDVHERILEALNFSE